MAVYAYRCADHGVHEVSRPIGTAAEREPCPDCAAPSSRVFTAPHLSSGSASARALLDRTARSASEPAVVSAPPPSRRPVPRATDPRLAKLARP